MSTLGTGTYDVFLTDRGGGNRLGRIPGVSTLSWNRARDDISTALLTLNEPTDECAAMMRDARTVRNELLIVRNGERVWEGPLTRIEYGNGRIECGASDVMWFATHRVLTTGWDWSNKGTPGYVGEDIIAKTLTLLQSVYGNGSSDPYGYNVGKFLTAISAGASNPRSMGIVAAYSRQVWDVIDQWAEDSGLDYTVIGRRILWWGVHHRAFQTQRMTDKDFNSNLVVTEYGMDLATRRYRTDNKGNVTYATAPQEWLDYYGPVDEVISNVDEVQSGTTVAVPGNPVKADIGTQYPAPVRIRLPENTGLSCDAPVSINELIPGAWVPVYSTASSRVVEQWMKLDRVNVTVGVDGSETVAVSMSQAPDGAVVTTP